MIGAVVVLSLVTYVAVGAMLLNNASATYFPRQLTVLLLTAMVANFVAGVLWPLRSLLLLAVASGSLAVLISLPSLAAFRLATFARAVPVSSADGASDSAARCLCTTRASLLEFFGPPDFLGDGDRGTARVYAYSLDGGHLVLYELGGRTGAEDRVIVIRADAASFETLGLTPWQQSR